MRTSSHHHPSEEFHVYFYVLGQRASGHFRTE